MADQDGSLGVQILPTGAVELTKHLEQGKIDDLQQRVLVLCREKDFLRKRLDKAEKDTHEFVNYFQKEIEKKDLKVKELTEQQQRTDLTAKQSIRAINDETSEKIRKIKAEADSVKIDLTNSLQSAQEEIHKLNHFREIKDSVDVHVQQLEETIGSLQKKATEDLNNQERKFLGEKSKMQKDMAKRTEAIKKEARIEAQAGLDSETKKIVTDNRRMGEELRFQLQMMSELQAEKAKSDDLVKQLRRDLSILQEKEKEYARQGQQVRTMGIKRRGGARRRRRRRHCAHIQRYNTNATNNSYSTAAHN
jgi:hypothetical protein